MNTCATMNCSCCKQDNLLTLEEFKARAIPRLAAIEMLAAKIDFSLSWKYTIEGERYHRLMKEQIADEVAAGL